MSLEDRIGGCFVCRTDVNAKDRDNRNVVVCTDCDAPYHFDCFKDVQKCSRVGCGCTSVTTSIEKSLTVVEDQVPTTDRVYSNKGYESMLEGVLGRYLKIRQGSQARGKELVDKALRFEGGCQSPAFKELLVDYVTTIDRVCDEIVKEKEDVGGHTRRCTTAGVVLGLAGFVTMPFLPAVITAVVAIPLSRGIGYVTDKMLHHARISYRGNTAEEAQGEYILLRFSEKVAALPTQYVSIFERLLPSNQNLLPEKTKSGPGNKD